MIVAVIPAYNEAARIASVLHTIPRRIDRVLVVNDGSSDATASVVASESARDQKIVLISHVRNRGMGAALRTGILYALRHLNARTIVTLDADGEHDPVELVRILGHLSRNDTDLVCGERNLTRFPLGRKLSAITTAGLIHLVSGLSVYDSQCGLRAFKASVVPKLSLSGDGYEFTTRFLIDVGKAKCRIAFVRIKTVIPDTRMTQYRRAPFSIVRVIRELIRSSLQP